MRKRFFVLLGIITMAVACFAFNPQNTDSVISSTLGNAESKIVLKTELPEIKTVKNYKIVDIERSILKPMRSLSEIKTVPSESEAVEILKGYLAENGGIPEGLRLKSVETVVTKVVNTETGEIEYEKPEYVSIIFGREVDGVPVVGPVADGIVASVADGEVIYLSKLWRKIEVVGETKLIPADSAFEKLKKGDLINTPLYEGKSLEVREIKVAYYADSEKQEYYKPVWLFVCRDDRGNWVDFIVDAAI
jgi:hypothetical protein